MKKLSEYSAFDYPNILEEARKKDFSLSKYLEGRKKTEEVDQKKENKVNYFTQMTAEEIESVFFKKELTDKEKQELSKRSVFEQSIERERGYVLIDINIKVTEEYTYTGNGKMKEFEYWQESDYDNFLSMLIEKLTEKTKQKVLIFPSLTGSLLVKKEKERLRASPEALKNCINNLQEAFSLFKKTKDPSVLASVMDISHSPMVLM